MSDMPLHRRPDPELEAALRGLADSVAWPAAAPSDGGPDVASVVRARIEAEAAGRSAPRRPSWSRWTLQPARRALVAAVIVLLALSALVGAAGLGLPGLRLLFGPPPVSPPPSLVPAGSPAPGASATASGGIAGEPGATLGLGERVDLAELDARAGFSVAWPADPAVGPPDAAYIDDRKGGQVALVWASSTDLPDTLAPGIGMILTAYRGTVEDGYITKALSSETTVELVLVDDRRAFWIGGEPHFYYFDSPDGFIEDSRRWVGDALLWTRGVVTYRLETSLGRDHAIELAEALD